MSYVTLYRAYRPSNFKEVSGQVHVVKTLQNAITSNKVSHAYLFSGPRGTGKTSIAKIFAKAINCLDNKDGNPCNKCSICTSINENKSSDIIEMDAASNSGIDDIRDLKDKVRFLPSECKYKVYIIDEAHALTTKAYNALLKTLEEPPGYVVFILATTEPYNIPTTILSRTQIFDFKGLELKVIEDRLKHVCNKEKIKITDEAIHNISLLADGGLRDALSLLDQTISYSNGNITINEVDKISGSVGTDLLIELANSINESNASTSLTIIDKLLQDGKEINRIISDLINFYKNVLLYKSNFKSENSLFKKTNFITTSQSIPSNKIYFYVDALANAQVNIKKTNQKRTYLEMAIIKMSDKNETVNLDIMNQLNVLTKRINQMENNQQTNIVIDDIKAVELKVKSNDSGNLIQITDIEKILNKSDKDSRVKLAAFWPTINKFTKDTILIKSLSTAVICAYGNNELLIAHDNIAMCDRLMQLETKEVLLNILSNSGCKVSNYFVVTKDIWKTISEDFKSKYVKDKDTKLTNIEINIKNYIKKLDAFEPEIIRKAKEFFPSELIEIED